MARMLAHYEVFEQLGAGGMGAVFRARDTRLGRDVALKLLPAALFADQGARRRLESEARLASSLNHPNICTIYEVGEAGDETWIAMELVGGGPLSERIPPGGLPPETVLRYGAEIAGALAHAHERGVLHRDLKAANVAITDDGRTKVLDFGLARRTAAAAGDDTRTLTRPGAIAGTPSHLAPELLRGAAADERSDLWALAVVLYEMAAGRLPFEGRTEYERTAKVLNDPPAPLSERVPPGLRGVILRGLEKDPRHRYPRASEVRAALEALGSDFNAPVAMRAGAPRPAWGKLAVGALLIVLLAAVSWLALKRPWERRELEQRQLTSNPPGDPIGWGVISPDGKTLAVIDHGGLFLRSIDSGESHALELPAGFSLLGQVFPQIGWYPDGSRLLISGTMTDGTPTEWAIPVLGGRAREVIHGGRSASISPDGTRLAWVRPRRAGAEIWSSGPSGENPTRITASDSTGAITSWAVWSPRGNRLAYARVSFGPEGPRASLESCDLAGRRRWIFGDNAEQTLHDLTIPLWLADGRMLFGLTDPKPNQADMNLWSLRVDPGSGAPSGKPRRVTQWQNLAFIIPTACSTDGKRLSVATLSYQSDCYVGRIAAGDSLLDGVRRLTLDDRMDLSPNWTPDSKAILFSSDRNGSSDLFRQALDATTAEPLVTTAGEQRAPIPSPDGAWILYLESSPAAASDAPPSTRIMRLPTAGGAPEKVLDIQPVSEFACARPPGSLCVVSELDRGETVWTEFDPRAGRGRELARTAGGRLWDLSPDGSAIAYAAQPDSHAVIHTLPLRGGAGLSVRLDRAYQLAGVTWAADGKGWFAIAVDEGIGWHLLRVRPDGHTSDLLPRQFWMYSAAASPDGHWLTYTSNTGDGNIWLLEGF